MHKMKLRFSVGITLILLLFTISLVSAEFFYPINQRYIATGENGNWFYIKIAKADGKNDYIGISKTDKGYVGLAADGEYIGRMFFVPAFKHPVNSKWYLCPLIDTGSYSVSLGDDYIDVTGSGTYTCYEYLDPVSTGSADLVVNQFRFTANPDASIKIIANITVTSASPSDTGFAFIFVPEDQSKFRYVKTNSVFTDLTGSEGDLTVDKQVEFFDAAQNFIGHGFGWDDMPTASNIMKVVTLGSKKGLLVGTYGYGASDNIFIDPIYYVDYTPEPAEWLLNGTVETYNDSQFVRINITTGISDDSNATSYDTYKSFVPSFTWTTDAGADETTEVSTLDGTFSEINHQFSASKWATINVTGGIIYNGDTLKLYVSPKGVPDSSQRIFVTNLNGSTIYASYYTPATVTYEWRNLTLANISAAGTDMIYLHDGGVAIIKARYDYVEFSTPVQEGKAIVSKWNSTYDPTRMWWLRLLKITIGNASVRVYAYDNNESIATAQYVDDTMLGTGWFNINISSLMDYETNTVGLNYTKLRFYSDNKHNFSEVRLRMEVNDTQLPRFQDCQINDTSLINNERARLRCNVTDDLDVDHVNGTIEGVTVQFVKNGDWYYYDWRCNQTNAEVNWTLVEAEDIVGNYNSTDPDLSLSCTYYTSFNAVPIPVNDFNITSSSYIAGVNSTFNTSLPNTGVGIFSSMNVKPVSGVTTSTIWVRVSIDGQVLTEEILRTVSGTSDEGSVGISPLVTILPSTGEHRLVVEFRRTSSGIVNVNDIDVNLVNSRTTDGSLMPYRFSNGTYSHSGDSFYPAHIWTVNKYVSSPTGAIVKALHVANRSGVIAYQIRQTVDNVTGFIWQRYLSSSTNIGSTMGMLIDSTYKSAGAINFSVDSKNNESAMLTDVNYTIVDFDIMSLVPNPVNYFSATNPNTNETSFVTVNDTWYELISGNVTIYDGDGVVIGMSASYKSLSGAQLSYHKINATGGVNCSYKKERYLSNANDIGNTFIYGVCTGFVVGQNYTISLWTRAETGNTLAHYDEVLFGLEISEFDITTGNVPPTPNSIIVPANNSIVSSSITVEWLTFYDLNNDFSYYNVTLHEDDGTLVSVLNENTTNLTQFFDITGLLEDDYKMRVTGCDLLGLCAYTQNDFTLSFLQNATITLSLYYDPFAEVNVQTTVHAIVKNATGDNYPNASVLITLDGSTAAMTWNGSSQSYIVYWIPVSTGTYPFNVTALTANWNATANGTIVVTDNFTICIRIWNNINMSDRYLNEFAWIYAIMPQQDPTEVLEHMFTPDENLACPPQGETTCYWHAKYVNGTACLNLHEKGNYTFYIIGNNIRWEQDIGSGYIQACEFCPPVEIQKRFLLPLGNYYVDGDENFDIYASEQELYYRGMFYGVLSSWLWFGILFILALVAFVGTLWLTKSLKSAVAMLIALPTIIWMIMTFTL